MEMYGETCNIQMKLEVGLKIPVLRIWGGGGGGGGGFKYWKKRSYIFQGFVTENPSPDDETPENPN